MGIIDNFPLKIVGSFVTRVLKSASESHNIEKGQRRGSRNGKIAATISIYGVYNKSLVLYALFKDFIKAL